LSVYLVIFAVFLFNVIKLRLGFEQFELYGF